MKANKQFREKVYRRMPVLLAAVLLLAAGCATPEKRARANSEAVASWPLEVREKVLAGEVEPGFTEEMVLVALGKPDRRYSRITESGRSTIWVYRDRRPGSRLSFGIGTGIGIGGGGSVYGGGVSAGTGGFREGTRVVLAEGKVVAVEEANR